MSDWTGREVMCVSVALVEHTGPWTPVDVEALPDAGDHARFEVYEGGVLMTERARDLDQSASGTLNFPVG